MSRIDLTTFRDHCRKMAASPAELKRPRATSPQCWPNRERDEDHGACEWGWQSCACTHHDDERPQPPSDAERALWTRLADEIDAWFTNGLDEITPDEHTEPLWEEAL